MKDMPKTKKETKPAVPVIKSAPLRKRGLLFELENVAVGGHQVVFDTIKKHVADKGAKLTPVLFSRYILTGPLKDGLGALLEFLGKGRVSADKLASDVMEDVKAALLKESLAIAPGLKKILKRAAEERVAVGVLSCLDRDTATQLVGRMKQDSEITTILPYACDGKSHPSPDAWLKLARMMSLVPGACVALSTSALSCKAAIASNVRCVVIPDQFTRFEDFGGADHVAETLDDTASDRIFSLLEDR